MQNSAFLGHPVYTELSPNYCGTEKVVPCMHSSNNCCVKKTEGFIIYTRLVDFIV